MSEVCVRNLAFKAGQTMKVKAAINSDASCFSINIGHSENDLALHFNPRFNAHGDSHTIVCNSRQGGAWGSEQRESVFPFQAGETFKVYITHNNDSFQVKLPDGNVVTFPNRQGDDMYNYFHMDGNAKFISIKVD
ncbi:LEG1 protein, partial [Atractosteus spatula]|nr:LEG1 protein [Atractosteus spatula]